MSIIQVYNEWDPVEEIIVGSAKYARIPKVDKGLEVIQNATKDLYQNLHVGSFPEWLVEETEEDIATFISELKKLNIRVKQPTPILFNEKFKTLDWEAEHFFCYCPRDIFLAFSDMIIETPNVFRSRYFETFAYKKILIDFLKEGSKWIAAPKPRLLDAAYNENDTNNSALNNIEPIFDAANVLRAGRDLFYLISDSGNELGCQWLQTLLGDKFRVHPCRNLYSSVHIDTTLCLLRPGLVLINPSRVNETNLPEPLRKWEVITAPEMVDFSYSEFNPMASIWSGMNLLMLRPDLAVVDAHQKPLIDLLAKKGIDSLPLKLRHGKVLGGGFHCITLDTKRKGTLEDYF